MIDCMKWLKSATGGGWALAIQKWIRFWSFIDKVENIFKKMDSIPSPSPSVIIQIIGGKVYLR